VVTAAALKISDLRLSLANCQQPLGVSQRTIGRILKERVWKGKIKPVGFYYGNVKVKKARVFNKDTLQ